MKRRSIWQRNSRIVMIMLILLCLLTSLGQMKVYAEDTSSDAYGYNPNLDASLSEPVIGAAVEEPVLEEPDTVNYIEYEEETTAEVSAETVYDVDIYESYDSDYDIYEQQFGGLFFFYTSISNGDITDSTVTLDIPQNIKYVVEKNGVETDSTSLEFKAEANYVIKLLGVDGTTTYRAVFRFRIQKKAESAVEPTESAQSSEQVIVTPVTQDPDEVIVTAAPEEEIIDAEIISEEDLAELTDEDADTTGSDEEVDVDEMIEEMTTPDEEKVFEGYQSEAYTGLKESYDYASALYAEELRSETVIYTNIPNGMITNGTVFFTIPEGVTYAMTKDDEEYAYVSGDTISINGSYTISFTETKVDYITNYVTPPVFQFRIITEPVKDMSVFNLPLGYRLESAQREGEEIGSADGMSILMKEDGVYRFNLLSTDEYNTALSVSITKDTSPPIVAMEGNKSEMVISYGSDDIAHIELYKDNVKLTDFSSTYVSDSGKYVLYVYDKAGNLTQAAFTLVYQMNSAGVIAIVIIAAMIGVAVWFLRSVKRDVKVR